MDELVDIDYAARIQSLRQRLGVTQARLAELLRVSFASVNRWENEQNRPSKLAWEKIVRAEQLGLAAFDMMGLELDGEGGVEPETPIDLDFAGRSEAIKAIVGGERLMHAHLYNPVFATEISRIDPLPHQRIAVYEHMLRQPRLRFLLADDAGAGKTIMSGLYLREMLARRLIHRVLIVPPAGLVGNWQRELRKLFNLDFRILTGNDAKKGNPFTGPESDHVIVSVDTLSGERMFGRLGEEETPPYDLVIFDEAHKLSASLGQDYRIRKTERYKLAEALAGIEEEGTRWSLPWRAHHLLLLTATPHMGKDFPYYCLWRLLEPDALSTQEAFAGYPPDARARHFIRRTKEEMVYLDGRPIYPTRISDTLSYDLSPGEQELYDKATDYIQFYYNRAEILNRSAARLVMSVFQRRLASSTYALLRSFERRIERLEEMIDAIRSGRITTEELIAQQNRLRPRDLFDEMTADEEAIDGDEEQNEKAERESLGLVVAISLAELEAERQKVQELRDLAQRVYDLGEESKFEKLLEVLQDSAYSDEKMLIFTEHRDTLTFLTERLEGLGYTGRIAQISGGMPYQKRDEQVEFFRRPTSEGGAQYLIATDAAGEGINLQFCWLMVNYDIPWNPARLEQRMGRIHRYGQKHDPVFIVNLAAGSTREGRVLQTLLHKLEIIRKELQSDKVFDVVGQVLEGVSIKEYLEQALSDEAGTLAQLDRRFTKERVQEATRRERAIYAQAGDPEQGDVKHRLSDVQEQLEEEQFRRLLPGYVRQFVARVAPLIGLGIEGDLDGTFSLRATQHGALDALWPVLERYSAAERDHLTVYRPGFDEAFLWVHPGEPVFDRLFALAQTRLGREAQRGAVFIDPSAPHPYLLHLALVTVVRKADTDHAERAEAAQRAERFVALRTDERGEVTVVTPEHLLLLQGRQGFPPEAINLIARARALRDAAAGFAREHVAQEMVQEERGRLTATLDERLNFLQRGFDHQAALLAEQRNNLRERFRAGEPGAKKQYERIKEKQRYLVEKRRATLEAVRCEPALIELGDVTFVAHALVTPSSDPDDVKRSNKAVEEAAMQVAMAHETARGATPIDVSMPKKARAAGLPDWPGFDVLSHHPDEGKRAIEVKGRARVGEVELSENEWASSLNGGKNYWLYVVYDCATAHPRLFRVQDPFRSLIANAKGGVVIKQQEIFRAAETVTN